MVLAMKIAYVYDAVYPYVKGGVERRIWEIGRRLHARGHEIHVYGTQYWPGPPTIRDEGVYIHGVAPARSLYRKGKRYPSQAIEYAARVTVPLFRKRFDVIDCQQFPYLSAFPSAFCAGMRRSALVLTWYEIWGKYWREYLGWSGVAGEFIERVLARLPAHHVADSVQTGNDLRRIVRNDAIELIPNGIEFLRIRQIPPAQRESDVVFAGRLIREKHVDVLIEAIGILARDNPSIKCLVIGDGPEKDNLKEKSTDLGLDRFIRFEGFIDYEMMISLIKSSKVFAFPSTREGFGIAALEGLACGLPLVTIDYPSNASRHFVTRGETGALCRLDPADMAEKIVYCCEAKDRMERACIGFAADYDWDPIAAHLERFYAGIAG